MPATQWCAQFTTAGEVVGVAIWKTDDSVTVEDIIATAAVSLAKFKVGDLF